MASGHKQAGHSDGGITEQVLIALRRIIRSVDLHSRSLVERYGLTIPQLAALRELSRRGRVPISELARAVHLSQATVTGILNRLERRALIHRSRTDPDRRRVLVELTRAGADILSQAPPPLRESFTEAFGELLDWEQTQILSSLQRVVAMMEAGDLDATPMLTTGPIDATCEHPKAFDRQKAGPVESSPSAHNP